jgi:outer membrane murein-binding lipoprotein Lpp
MSKLSEDERAELDRFRSSSRINWTTVILALIAGAPGLLVAWHTNRIVAPIAEAVPAIAAQVNQVEKATNSMSERLQAAAHAAGTAEGTAVGRAEQKEEMEKKGRLVAPTPTRRSPVQKQSVEPGWLPKLWTSIFGSSVHTWPD